MAMDEGLLETIRKLLPKQAALHQILEVLNSHGYQKGEVGIRATCQTFAALATIVLQDKEVQGLATVTLEAHALRTMQETFPYYSGRDRVLPPAFWEEAGKRLEEKTRRMSELRHKLHVKLALLAVASQKLEELGCTEKFDWPALSKDTFPSMD